MLITEKSGNIKTSLNGDREIDIVFIEWHEANKRILHKQTNSGIAITLRFLNGNPDLEEGDILFKDENRIIAVEIVPCECIVIRPGNIRQTAALCYEIGNRHLPLYYEDEELLIPFEMPAYNLLQASGYGPQLQKRKLNHCFKTTVLPHLQLGGTDSLFSKFPRIQLQHKMNSTGFLQLLHLSDPSLPIGGFSHSAGLETYVQEKIVYNKETASEFVTQQLSQNIFYTDGALVSLAYDAAFNNDLKTVLELDELCTAVKLPMEIRLASNKLGTRLLKIFLKEEKFILPNDYNTSIKTGNAFGHYCIAFGLLANAMHVNKEETLAAFYYNAATGFVTNAVKLIPLGQQDGQEILMSLFPLLKELVEKSLVPAKEMIGYCCAGFDIRCMQHEQLYSRLYMS